MKLSKQYKCDLCEKPCTTDKLGYRQGMVTVWKYGEWQDNLHSLCTPCRESIHQHIESLRKEEGK